MIYILCPKGVVTGGTELLHQLGYELSKYTCSVRLVYIGDSASESKIPERFICYNPILADHIEDNVDSCVIAPEIYPQYLMSLKHARRILWWLSVDMYFQHRQIALVKRFQLLPARIAIRLDKFYMNILKLNDVIHLSQSKYAEEFLMSKKIISHSLTDYLNESFLEERPAYSANLRKNQILYNPKKGMEITQHFINWFHDITFVPLQNMTPKEVVELCKVSKIYIDFGEHPGKDRLPREASIMGCAVITGRRGSAGYYEDLPIPEEFKFHNPLNSRNQIRAKFQEIFESYDSVISKYAEHHKMILDEKNRFQTEVNLLWGMLFNKYGSQPR